MSIESRTYDKSTEDGFPPEPVLVLVVSGKDDVARLVWLFNGGTPAIEHYALGDRLNRQLSAHSTGVEALKLLHQHGGPDFTEPDLWEVAVAVAGRNPHDGRSREGRAWKDAVWAYYGDLRGGES